MLLYLSEVPVNPHSFLHSLSAVEKTRLGFIFADNSYAAVVTVFVGLDAADVELTSRVVISVLKYKRKHLPTIFGTTGKSYQLTFQRRYCTVYHYTTLNLSTTFIHLPEVHRSSNGRRWVCDLVVGLGLDTSQHQDSSSVKWEVNYFVKSI